MVNIAACFYKNSILSSTYAPFSIDSTRFTRERAESSLEAVVL